MWQKRQKEEGSGNFQWRMIIKIKWYKTTEHKQEKQIEPRIENSKETGMKSRTYFRCSKSCCTGIVVLLP